MIVETQAYGLHPDDVKKIVQLLNDGEVGIVPTDSVFAFCGRLDSKNAYETICRLKKLDPKEAMMSMVCKDLSQASQWFAQWETPVYRILNRNLPGPFTFIMDAGSKLPGHVRNKKKTIGLRIPSHKLLSVILQELDSPLIVSSVRSDDDVVEYFTDMHELIQAFEKQVAFIVEDVDMVRDASTVVNMTSGVPEIIRQSRFELAM